MLYGFLMETNINNVLFQDLIIGNIGLNIIQFTSFKIILMVIKIITKAKQFKDIITMD